MPSKTFSATVVGLNVTKVTVEVDIDKKSVIHDVDIVGLGDTAVKESKKRVKSALKNSGFSFPHGRIIVNLAPADVKKEGSLLDLPIAVGILQATGTINQMDLLAVGELSLEGKIRGVRGVLTILLQLAEENYKGIIIVPKENIEEAQMVKGLNVYAFDELRQVVEFVNGLVKYEPVKYLGINSVGFESDLDFADVKGQQVAKRALEIAAAGGHNVLMKGSPGSGKTMLARRFPTILPPLTEQEAIEILRIYSTVMPIDGKKVTRPFRAPHHTASSVAIIGGGNDAKPGEVTLAHNGVLFLDEFPEFRRDVIEALRQPLEEGIVTVARAKAVVTYPARFTLIAAMNPCPCGNYGDPKAVCSCSPYDVVRYNKKVSGPILDRIDILVQVPRMDFEELFSKNVSEPSEKIRERVVKAREIQAKRYSNYPFKTNATIPSRLLKQFVQLDEKSHELLKNAAVKYSLSARSIDKILRLSRTIADLESSDKVSVKHVAEALQYKIAQES
ncbi:YifB family Mg chelatase-like AAA ATPase [Pseudothermotoga thermarum]|uniref:Mg chelatase, subunit ChlI n=1 Tax=Pseudothermotoga thermarum DSM 5069 TaxID=688269 RepID=F7YWD6_9THEM|nr:YifB family Mg chelatase-like AAA ATPase [Pseudothermotoga thermarum]AEH51914.1 Mg chelatase, subunit ChlI [Pseudothermotoga thermarum DSM 5069]